MNWNLNTYSGVLHAGYLWFSNKSFNGLFRQDISNGNIEFIDFFPNERIDICHAHKKVLCVGEKLFFIPAQADNIHIYDFETENFTTIPIKKKNGTYCAEAILYGDSIYIFTYYGELFVLNVENLKIESVAEFAKRCRESGCSNEEYIFCRVSESDGTVYFAFYGCNMVGSYNLSTGKYDTFYTGINDLFMCHVSGNKCWLTTKKTDEIFLYDILNKESRLIYSKDRTKRDRVIYNQVFSHNGVTWFVPAFSGKIISVDDYCNCVVHGEFVIPESDVVSCFGGVKVGDELWLLPFSCNGVFAIDGNGRVKNVFPFFLVDKISRNRIISKLWDAEPIIRENDGTDLKDYLSFVEFKQYLGRY